MVLLCVLPLSGCAGDEQPLYRPSYGPDPGTQETQYIFAVHPILSPQKLSEVYGAILAVVNARLAPDKITLRLEASRDYKSFNAKLRERRVHFALPNPYQTLLSLDCGYRVFGKMDGDDDFRGVILLRKDSAVRTLADLRGKSVAFPAPTALAGTMLPQLYMQENGLDVTRDIELLYVGTHNSAMQSVALGTSAAACTWPLAWRAFQNDQPEVARQLEVRWTTDSLPSNGLVVRDDVPERVREKVAQALFGLAEGPEGREALTHGGVPRLVPAEARTFEPVRRFVERFQATIRPLKGLHE